MLGPHWRVQVYNGTGAVSGAITVKGLRWKPNATDGSKAFEGTEQTFLTAVSLASVTWVSGTSISNIAVGEGYYGASLRIEITGGTAAGDYTVILQHSTDGGVTWPNNGEGVLLGVFNVAASTAEIMMVEF